MFSSAFKSFSSNIISAYEISKQPTATSGVWTIFDAKKKNTGAQASVFVFERKLLDVQPSGLDRRTSATSVRKIQDEVVERLKKEASSLARLRHPSILQLVEPVEDTRSGGLMFATEPIIASLSGALAQKDRNDRTANGRRDTRDYGVSPASRASQEIDLDELEIQKGLLQVAKGLEFLHDSAKLVHGNLTPDAIFINAKSDWKISGLSFAGPPDRAEGHQSMPQISLSEVLYHDARIPPTVQLNLDYSSPDFVLDANINFSADIFSLGLLLLACYRSPHTSPIETHGNQTTYKKIFSSSSTVPSPQNNYLCSTKLPNELESVLPRILARRPAQRMNAAEFQQSEYFDNILVNTMRFLDGLPAKTSAEKSQFMRGLQRVMPQFPPSVLGKKILTALLDELKDKELLSLILENIFLILQRIPNREDAIAEKVLPRLRDIFLAKSKSEERDTSKEAGLNVFLSNIQLITENASAKQFKDDALPIIGVALESQTHPIVDAALSTLSHVLPVLDFTTVKHDLFPVIANVFSKTNSLSIKVRGLEALGVLCGASEQKQKRPDDFSGVVQEEKPKQAVSSLDKFTMQEKVVPLLKGIKTKEPAVMMAALKVFQQIAKAGDTDFLAIEVMPILWSFALGPLLDLSQFMAYMDTIRALSSKIEREQIRKLQELSTNSRPDPTRHVISPSIQQTNGAVSIGAEDDFEKLVLGGRGNTEQKDVFAGVMSEGQKLTANAPTFSWSSGSGTTTPAMRTLQPTQPISRSITPDVHMSSFPSLQPAGPTSSWPTASQPPPPPPQQQRLQATNYTSTFNNVNSSTSPSSSTTWSQSAPLQPSTNTGWSQPALTPPSTTTTISWSQPAQPVAPPPSSTNFTPMLAPPPPPPSTNPQPQRSANYNSFNSVLTPTTNTTRGTGVDMNVLSPQTRPGIQQMKSNPIQGQAQKSGLDKYESLL
ncbi:hypothetical protein R6Q59_010073 [Mikania micrantha]